MKNVIVIFLLCLCSFSYAQTNQSKDKLKNFYGIQRYDYLVANHPKLVKTLSFRINNGYVLLDKVNSKYKDLPIQENFDKRRSKSKTIQVHAADIIQEINDGTFNILRYNFGQKKDQDVVIRLDQNHVLIIRSVRTLINIRMHKS